MIWINWLRISVHLRRLPRFALIVVGSEDRRRNLLIVAGRVLIGLAVVTILTVVSILIFVGVYLRGPYWKIYWPGTPRPQMPKVL